MSTHKLRLKPPPTYQLKVTWLLRFLGILLGLILLLRRLHQQLMFEIRKFSKMLKSKDK